MKIKENYAAIERTVALVKEKIWCRQQDRGHV